MDNMTEQIESLLSDPAGMERIRKMAEGLLSGNTAPPPKKEEPEDSGINVNALISAAKALSSRQDDERVRLLKALRPHLSYERQQRVDKAIKMLRLLDMAPLLSNMGLFELGG